MNATKGFVSIGMKAFAVTSLSLFAFAGTSVHSSALAQEPIEAQGAMLTPESEIYLPGPAVKIIDFRDPDTQEKIEVSYQPATKEHLRMYAPSKVRTMVVGVPPAGGGFSGAAKKLAIDFPAEYLAFTTAVAISTGIHLDNDPMFAQNFVTQNTSAAGVISFAGFVAGSRASHAALQAFGVAYDPRRVPIDYRLETPYTRGQALTDVATDRNGGLSIREYGRAPGRPDYINTRSIARPIGPTRVQKIFAPLLGPIGLAAGMTVSNIIHELIADPNLTLCAKGRYSKPTATTPDARQLLDSATDEACDKFWEDWAIGKKAADWAPDMLAMGAASIIQAYVVNKGFIAAANYGTQKAFVATARAAGVTVAKNQMSHRLEIQAVKAGAEKFVPIVLRGVRIAGFTLGATPVGKLVMTTANIAIFMEIVHPISPLLKKPFEQMRQGNDIAARINSVRYELDRAEKDNWVWTPRPDSEFCTGMEMDATGMPAPNTNCYAPEQKEPAFLLKKMAERQAKWREFILQDAYLAHTNWKGFVSRFITMYANATAFYQQTLAHINYQRFSPKAKVDTSYFYKPEPFYGLYTDPAKRGKAAARVAITEARAWLEVYLETARLKGRNSKYRMHSTEASALPEILNGLRALDPSIDFISLNTAEASFRNLNGMNPAQRAGFEIRARERMVEIAIRKLRRVLLSDVAYNDRHVPFNSPMYTRMAQANPFMALRMRLGDPEPLAEGVAFLRGTNDDASIIEQESKGNHPGGIGRIRAGSMADYLAISMVCGPEADPRYSDAEKVRIFKQRHLSTTEKIFEFFGLGRRVVDAKDAQVLIAVNEHIEQITQSQKNWYHVFSPNAVATEWTGFYADFRPPRIVENVPVGLCDSFPSNSRRDQTMDDAHAAMWKINGHQYEGILDIIRKNARPDIVGTSLPPDDEKVKWVDPFDAWWTSKIDKYVVEMVAQFRAKYRLVLKDKYLPALTRNGTDDSVQYGGQPIKLGALEALYAEAELYLEILGKTSTVTKDAKLKTAYAALSMSVGLEFRNMGQLAADIEFVEQKGPIAKAAYDIKRKALETRLGELKKFVEDRHAAVKGTADAQKINDQTLKNLNGLMGEMDSYWGIVRAIQVVAH